MLNRVQIKMEAKEVVRSARASAYVMTLIYLLLVNLINAVDLYAGNGILHYVQEHMLPVELPSFLIAPDFPPLVIMFVTVMVFLLTTVLGGGLIIYHLGVRRGYEMGYSTLFDGFSIVGKLILGSLCVSALVTVGMMLLVIPGIILSYMYRFTIYNICENPELGVINAMRMSRLQTSAHKADLFMLDLSFIGWLFLCGLTMGVLSIWINPYMEQANIGYFEALKRSSGVGYIPNEPTGGPNDDPYSPLF